MLQAVIVARFKTLPGSRDVALGNYELFKTEDSSQVITSGTSLLPGTRVTMAVLVLKPKDRRDVCPRPQCGSDRLSRVRGGGKRW